MKQKRVWPIVLSAMLAVAVILAGGISYLANIRRSLWNESITNILEVTAQGGHALDTYIEQDTQQLHTIALALADHNAQDSAAIGQILHVANRLNNSYFCVDLDAGIGYVPVPSGQYALEPEQTAVFRALTGQGMREPYLDGYTGVWNVAYYERFTFADGTAGYVQKTQARADLAEEFSLSFYDDSGFSYVVNRAGDILIRSEHRNSNRTIQNLFDIIDLQGNEAQVVQSFRTALAQGKRGAARFQYQDEEYVFCYVPMNSTPDWYVVSIVPNGVIMEQAEQIMQNSQVFVVLILFCVLMLTAFFLLYRGRGSGASGGGDGPAGGGKRQPCEKPLPVQHVPRYPHPDERHHRDDAAGVQPHRRTPKGAGISEKHRAVRPAAGQPGQRHSRPVQD